MKTLDKVLLGILFVVLFDMVSFAIAQKPKEIDELDLLIAKSKTSMSKAGTVVQAAAKAEEKTLTAVVSHIEEVEQEAEVAKQKIEIFSVRMLEAGIDTAQQIIPDSVNFAGPIWDEYQLYLKNGGQSDFEYYRLYKK